VVVETKEASSMRSIRRLRPFSLFALIALAFGSLFTGALPAAAVGECGPLDVGFVIDDTGSMGGALANVQAESSTLLDQIDDASAGDFQLALLSFKDIVTVLDDLAAGNRAAVESDIQGLTASGGANPPEASDEALNTAVNGLDEADREPGQQVGDFNGTWRSEQATRILILITDERPGGFDDDYTSGTDDVNAHDVAVDAAGFGMLISAVYVPTAGVDPTTSGVMQDYATTTGGVYVETAADGTGTSSAISDIIAGCGEGGTTTGTIPPGGGTVASPPIGGGVKQQVVVKAGAGTPGGEVTIQIPDPNPEPCPDDGCYGVPMHVTGFDTGSSSNPLVLRFVFAKGVFPATLPLREISMTRNEVEVPRCRPGHPDPCQRSIGRNSHGRIKIVIVSSDETDPRYRGRG
jgi:von Willebrand factor type A domain-containing protein